MENGEAQFHCDRRDDDYLKWDLASNWVANVSSIIIQLNINKKIIARYGSYIVYVYVLDLFYRYALQMCNVHIFNKMLNTTVACCAIYIYCVIEGAVGRRLVWGHLVSHRYAIFLWSLDVEIKHTVATLHKGGQKYLIFTEGPNITKDIIEKRVARFYSYNMTQKLDTFSVLNMIFPSYSTSSSGNILQIVQRLASQNPTSSAPHRSNHQRHICPPPHHLKFHY